MKVDSFHVLSEMCDQDQTGKFQKAFTAPNNFMGANTGKDGWGFIKMAVDNQTVLDLATGRNLAIVLLVYDIDEFKRIKSEMESTPQRTVTDDL